MLHNYLSFCLIGIWICLVPYTVARVAIVGADIAKPDQFPYQVSLQIKDKHLCGGGIIAERFILTAAHCVLDEFNQLREQFTAVAGTNNLHHHVKPSVKIGIERAFVPKEFDRMIAGSIGDIAVLKLKSPLKPLGHGHLQKLHLPESENETFVGKTAWIAGFGWTSVRINDNDRHGENIDGLLRFAEADVLNSEQCPHYNHQEVHKKKMCARVKQRESQVRGVCSGDSGSPLVDKRNTLIGILSIGPYGCSEKQRSATYTRVSKYLTFIYNAMEGKKTHDMHEYDLGSHTTPSYPTQIYDGWK